MAISEVLVMGCFSKWHTKAELSEKLCTNMIRFERWAARYFLIYLLNQ
jgi:hypothetical protein